MLRRVLPVAAAAGVVLIPSTAWATPEQAPVETYQGASYSAQVEDVVLPNGWHVTAWLDKRADRSGLGYLSLDVWDPYECWDQTCSSHSFASVELTDEEIDFDRGLRTASVRDVSVEIVDPTHEPTPDDPGDWGPGPWVPEDPVNPDPWPTEDPVDPNPWTPEEPSTPEGPWTQEDPLAGGDAPADEGPVDDGSGDDYLPEPEPTITLTVDLTLTGTGAADRGAGHSTTCGDGERICQAMRLYASRDAVARLTLGDQTAETSSAQLFYGHYVDAAAPKFHYDGY